MSFKLKYIPCPSCKHFATLSLEDRLSCRNPNCDFDEALKCPCGHGLKYSHNHWHCNECDFKIQNERLVFCLNNYYQIELEKRCNICQSPTLSNSLTDLKDRCIHFPNCSVQSDLFGEAENKETYVFLDFETTGLNVGLDEIIEFGAIKVAADKTESLFQCLVKPEKEIPPHITKITHINNEMVNYAAKIAEVLPDFLSFIEGAILVAHHADFDVKWLINACDQLGISLPAETRAICTLEWAKKLKEPRCSLGVLTKKFNIVNQAAHRALADAIATKHLFFEFERLHSVPAPIRELDSFINKTSA